MKVDLRFNIVCEKLPKDHAYSLFSAISHIIPEVHDSNDIGIFPVTGISSGEYMYVQNKSLTIRLDYLNVPKFIKLSGKKLIINDCQIKIGIPTIYPIVPKSKLYSSRVLIKFRDLPDDYKITPDKFLSSVRLKLNKWNIKGNPYVDKFYPRLVRINKVRMLAFPLNIDNLTDDESMILQENDVFKKQSFGCGLFK